MVSHQGQRNLLGRRLFIAPVTRFSKLGADLPRLYRHDDGLHSTDFLITNPDFFGDPKVAVHSRIATTGHGAGQVQHDGGSLVEVLIVASAPVESPPRPSLFLG